MSAKPPDGRRTLLPRAPKWQHSLPWPRSSADPRWFRFSEGVVLVYGRDERTVEAASLVKDKLDVTVLLTKPGDIAPRRVTEFPVVKGTIRSAKGHLGAFELLVDDYAAPIPSSRSKLAWASPKNGATSNAISSSIFPAEHRFQARTTRATCAPIRDRPQAAVL